LPRRIETSDYYQSNGALKMPSKMSDKDAIPEPEDEGEKDEIPEPELTGVTSNDVGAQTLTHADTEDEKAE
jgi:hypothetical protein